MTSKGEEGSHQLFAGEPMSLDAAAFDLLPDVPEDGGGIAADVVDLPPSLPDVVENANESGDSSDHNNDIDNEDDGENEAGMEDASKPDDAHAHSPLASQSPLPGASPPPAQTEEPTTVTSRADRFSSSNRPFPCHVCGKRFVQKAHLIIHKRTHTGEKPYACHICHKRFAQSSHLTVHKRVHTGEKPFFCNFCGIGFCRRPRLEAHILQHVVQEGRQLPAGFKGSALTSLSLVGLHGTQYTEPARGVVSGRRGRGRGRWARSRGRRLTGVGRPAPNTSPLLYGQDAAEPSVKSEPADDDDDDNDNCDSMDAGFAETEGDDAAHSGRRLSGPATRSRLASPGFHSGRPHTYDDLDPNLSNVTKVSGPHGRSTDGGLGMTGLVRTNSRISLVDFSAADIMQHLMSRDDVKSCDYCCIVFMDPAMYYLHRCMHDKMDLRRCNMCGKMAADKYDFMAHFLSQHK